VSARAGIVVTGTEVLTGRVADRNGPWLADRLEELGVDLAHIAIVGDRPADMLAALRFMAAEGLAVVVTSGGLGPTADDLTAEVVGEFQGRAMVLDAPLEARIAEILRPLAKRWPELDMAAVRRSNRKQAVIPEGSTILAPVGTAPGLVVPPAEDAAPTEGAAPKVDAAPTEGAAPTVDAAPTEGAAPTVVVPLGEGAGLFEKAPPRRRARAAGPTVVVLPGPPRELQPMWAAAVETQALREALAGAPEYRRRMLRLFGIPESEIAETLRTAAREGVELERLEITTCLRRGEIEVVTRYEPDAEAVYDAFVAVVRMRHTGALFSEDGSSVDEQVARLLRGASGVGEPRAAGAKRSSSPRARTQPATGAGAARAAAEARHRVLTIATAESCTGGLLAARLTELPGSSEYVRGGIVAYSNAAKIAQVGVPAELIERHGAVSREVALALAEGARERLEADVGVGVTGVAGPGGGTDAKPVGLVCLSVAGPDGASLTRAVQLPGGRADVRDRASTVALHLVRRRLRGERDA
jgi:nicotinamide-nucleotide amidase